MYQKIEALVSRERHKKILELKFLKYICKRFPKIILANRLFTSTVSPITLPLDINLIFNFCEHDHITILLI